MSRVTSLAVGDFVYFSNPDQPHVQAGVVLTASGDEFTVHEYRQAPVDKTRFTPLYTNSQNGRLEAKLKPQTVHTPVIHDITLQHAITSGKISTSYHIDETLQHSLRSLGILDQD